MRGARITDLWGLGPSEVIAVVGAGGKSTLLEGLARAYESEGARVVLTTTTKMWPSEGEAAEKGRTPSAGRPPAVAETVDGLADRVERVLAGEGASPVVGSRITADGKLDGVPPEWVPALRDLPGVEAVLVEADGAAGRPLKHPAEWEPVLPHALTLLVVSAGLDVLGSPLDAESVHRAGLAAERTGLGMGAEVDPDALFEILLSGYATWAPAHSRLLLYLNKRDVRDAGPDVRAAVETHAAGIEVWTGSARGLVDGCGPGGLPPAPPELLGAGRMPPAVVIPAAGRATRMGGAKVLAPLGAGTVLGRVVGAALRSAWCAQAAAPVLVVAGEDPDDVRAALEREHPGAPWQVVPNPDPDRGMASSLRVGVQEAGGPRDLLVLLGDQPLLEPGSLDRVFAAWREQPRAAAAGAGGDAGPRPPVVLNRSLLPQILGLHGDRGARDILARYPGRTVAVDIPETELLDVDTPEALAEARHRLADGRRRES